MEEASGQKVGQFCSSILEKSRQLYTEIFSVDAKLGKIPYVSIWKPTAGATRWNMKKASEALAFRHLEIKIEGQLGDKPKSSRT